MIETYIYILALVGLFLSIYTVMVERRARKEKNYRPVCDIQKHVSCTKAFASKYGSHLGVSNGFFGAMFYLAIIVLISIDLYFWAFCLAIVSVIGSLYLGYVLFFRLKDICIVCTSIYIVNIVIAIILLRIVF